MIFDEEKWKIVKKFLSSHVYEDKLIGIEMLDDNIMHYIPRVDINHISDANRAKGCREYVNIWDKIYNKYANYNLKNKQ